MKYSYNYIAPVLKCIYTHIEPLRLHKVAKPRILIKQLNQPKLSIKELITLTNCIYQWTLCIVGHHILNYNSPKF